LSNQKDTCRLGSLSGLTSFSVKYGRLLADRLIELTDFVKPDLASSIEYRCERLKGPGANPEWTNADSQAA